MSSSVLGEFTGSCEKMRRHSTRMSLDDILLVHVYVRFTSPVVGRASFVSYLLTKKSDGGRGTVPGRTAPGPSKGGGVGTGVRWREDSRVGVTGGPDCVVKTGSRKLDRREKWTL